MSRGRHLVVALLLSGVTWPGRASADAATAEALFDEGLALYERGEFAAACAKFEASESQDIAVGTLLRLGDCYERTGRLASAWARFREAGSLAQTQGMSDRVRIAAIRARSLAYRMARLTLSLPPQLPEGFHLELNGTAILPASFGSSLPVDPGTLVVRATAPGFLPQERRVTVPSQDSARVKVALSALEPDPSSTSDGARTLIVRMAPVASPSTPPHALTPPPPQPSVRHDRGYGVRVAGISLAALGGVGLATSGALAVLANHRNQASRRDCPDDEALCTQRGVELRREAGKLADAATISAAAGGGLLAAGLVLYWAAPSGHEERVALQVVPDWRTGELALRARGSF